MEDSLFLSAAPSAPHLSPSHLHSLSPSLSSSSSLSLPLSPSVHNVSQKLSWKSFFEPFKAWSLNTWLLCCQPTLCQKRESACAWQQGGRMKGLALGAELVGQTSPFYTPICSCTHTHTHTHTHACTDPLTRTRGAQKMCTWQHTQSCVSDIPDRSKKKKWSRHRDIDANQVVYSVKLLVCAPLNNWTCPPVEFPSWLSVHSPVN